MAFPPHGCWFSELTECVTVGRLARCPRQVGSSLCHPNHRDEGLCPLTDGAAATTAVPQRSAGRDQQHGLGTELDRRLLGRDGRCLLCAGDCRGPLVWPGGPVSVASPSDPPVMSGHIHSPTFIVRSVTHLIRCNSEWPVFDNEF